MADGVAKSVYYKLLYTIVFLQSRLTNQEVFALGMKIYDNYCF